ncbi:sulfotransferase [Marinobacter metalliresistant]|uniref:Sulfotransferase n=1 Tax=Marinobacter metalliresistant TaxID=2961995 RepID=A0ABZ2W5S8_9GAMM
MQKFFITGLPKTGSTWVMQMLNDISGIQCLGEGRFFSSGLRHVPSLYDSILTGTLHWAEFIAQRKRNWLDDNDSIRTIEKYNYVSESRTRKATDHLTKIMIQSAIEALLNDHITLETVAIGDKTPTLEVEALQRIENVFPDANIVFLHRGLHDFLASFMCHYHRSMRDRRPDANFEIFTVDDFLAIDTYLKSSEKKSLLPVTETTLNRLIQVWIEFDEAFTNAKSRHNFITINYESLLEDTHTHMSEILKLVAPKVESSDVENAIHQWSFGSQNMQSGPNNAHINSREVGYGRTFFAGKSKNHIDQALEHRILSFKDESEI